MNIKMKCLFFCLLFLFAMTCFYGHAQTAKYNQFHVGEIWLDINGDTINAHGGNIVYYNKTYYWFGEKRNAHQSLGVNVYSSKDLYNWKPEGLALAHSDDTTSDIAWGGIMERPKVIFNRKTKKFVMWFHVEVRGKGYGAAKVGVAVSDRITGPYKFVRSFRPNGNMSRDMTVYVDDDGSAYEIYSSRENYDMRIVKLTDDYLNVTAKDSLLFSAHREAPAIFKYNKKYYLITSACTGWASNKAIMRVADNLYGEWKIVGNPMRGKDSNITFGGQSAFIFPLPKKKNSFIYVGDKWNPRNLEDSRYHFLPIEFSGDDVHIDWYDTWNLDVFNKK
ncbi:beta-glucanase [Arachidicoccus ginsenosidimutans]|uniref:glycoside hydrolase family 43 protein n=1 Tax=Arachidicoccus sp. BS20 TaxID=1850526 RepID=UPI0007F0B269|nr:glycoside hydrolase family 43 protein [Arachidicoccus sp. BS20]ANI90386.1 beta-glucanase [Arachidicoccus sp. BS20]